MIVATSKTQYNLFLENGIMGLTINTDNPILAPSNQQGTPPMTLTQNDIEFMRLAGAAHESGLRQMRLRKLNDANAHRHTFKTLLEATCTDCCCKVCICDDVADMNNDWMNDEAFEALRSHSHDY